jgi:hypothetical protein
MRTIAKRGNVPSVTKYYNNYGLNGFNVNNMANVLMNGYGNVPMSKAAHNIVFEEAAKAYAADSLNPGDIMFIDLGDKFDQIRRGRVHADYPVARTMRVVNAQKKLITPSTIPNSLKKVVNFEPAMYVLDNQFQVRYDKLFGVNVDPSNFRSNSPTSRYSI